MRISVVIPARNDADMLGRALETLASQRRPPDEIVVVDNGSSDATAEVARRAGARVVWEPVQGIPRASARGYDAAEGDVIARIDADSLCPPGWLERIERSFGDPALDLLTGTGRFYGGTPLAHALGERLYLGGFYWFFTPYLGHPPVFGSNFAMRRSVWQELAAEVHRHATDIHDDLDLSLHVKPWMTVRMDPSLQVAISARPFDTWEGFSRRVYWAWPTLRNHWPEDAPWHRRAARREYQNDGREAVA